MNHRTQRRATAWFALLLGLLIPPAAPRLALAAPPQKMTFRNNLLPGQLTVHRISRTITRLARRKAYVERLTYRHQAEWVQCNIEENKPGKTMVYQMMVEQPAEVLGLRHDKKKVKPTPPAADFGLTQGTPALRSSYRTPQDSPAQVPLTDPAERAILNALLDFTHWPAKQIEPGHKWERDLVGGGITGTQRFEFLDVVEEAGGKAVARVALRVTGKFEDALAKDYTFGGCQAMIYWSRLDRLLVKLEGTAAYQRQRENAPEEYTLKLTLDLTRFDQLKEPARESIVDQMLLFSQAQTAQRDGNVSDALEACRKFRKTWPDSIWMPVVDELEHRLQPKKPAESEALSESGVDELLVKTVIAYEAARTNYEYDLLARAGEVLGKLAEKHHGDLMKLAKGKDDGRRGRAIFALAFSSRPDDLHTVEKAARDQAAAVRAMALAGLAARRNPDTSAELLVVMLDDPDTQVRRRACEAIAACMSPEHYTVVKAVEKIASLMIEDENAGVRREAIRALGVIGAPADIPRLEAALSSELNPENREEINRAISKLQAKNG